MECHGTKTSTMKKIELTIFFICVVHIMNLIAQNDTLPILLDRKVANRDFDFSPALLGNADFQKQVTTRMVKISENVFQWPHAVRSNYYDVLSNIYEVSKNEKDRKQLIGALIHSCNDQSEWLRAQNMRFLAARIKPEDISKNDLNELYQLLIDTVYHRTPLFPIVGRLDWKEGELLMKRLFLEGPEILPIDMSRPDGFIASPKWKAAIALAIKGDEQATQYLIAKTKQQTDPRVLKLVFTQLTFVRTRPILDTLIEFLYSDRKYNYGAGHMEDSDFSMAYAALYELIEGIWETNGDTEATRVWIDKNRTSYKILKY